MYYFTKKQQQTTFTYDITSKNTYIKRDVKIASKCNKIHVHISQTAQEQDNKTK